MKNFLIIVVLHAVSGYAGEQLQGKVINVVDGNTLELRTKEKDVYTIRLHGIDCPELTQEYGEKARKLLEKVVLNKEVTVSVVGKDRRGNRLGFVLVNGTTDPSITLLKEGLAWTAEQNPIPELENYRLKAAEQGKGLWKSENPTPPWIYRRQQTMMQAKTSS